jgi:hypothetical protein
MGAMALVKRRPISPFKMGKQPTTYNKLREPVDTLKNWSQKAFQKPCCNCGNEEKNGKNKMTFAQNMI